MKTFGLILLVLGLGCTAMAQESVQDLKKEIDVLRQEQQALRKEVQDIKALILNYLAPLLSERNTRNIEFELGDNPVRGENTARLTLVEFTDYQ